MNLFYKSFGIIARMVATVFFSVVSVAAFAQLEPGEAAPPLKALTSDGVTISSDSLKGKVVLVDFWASWCAPCRKANKSLADAYPSLATDGLTVISLSIDNDKSAWQKAISMDKLLWTQLHDGGGWDSPSALAWKVEALPTAYLLGIDGNIAMVDPSIEQIRKYLAAQKSMKP